MSFISLELRADVALEEPLRIPSGKAVELRGSSAARPTLSAAALRSPRIPVICNVDAQSHDDPEVIRDLLIRQVVAPVRWEESMRRLIDDGCSRFYELGPGRVLRGLLRRIDRKIDCTNVTC